MDDELQLSIIVTTYNVAPYVRQCLGSAVRQRLPAGSFEVVAIDDHSTDGTLDVIEECARLADNIRVVPLPVNTPGGFGFSANLGVKVSRGKYVGFIDGDDYASLTMFPKLMASAAEVDADVALCGFNTLNVKAKKVSPWRDDGLLRSMSGERFGKLDLTMQKIFYLHLSPVPWRKLYKKSFLQENNITVPVGDFFYEDAPFHWACTILANRLTCIKDRLVTHRIYRSGQTMSVHPEKRIKDFLINFKIIYKFLKKQKCYDTYEDAFFDFVWDYVHSVKKNFEVDDAAIINDIFTKEEAERYWNHINEK
ncbi:MAG: glycosyltransferase family 2 protein [Desulfovibrio sp.]|jgi:glycosyltransferase involved in cell wall biosynthesis|nr:glycosyltransferase family 2 protein [Desulfovibrio sp.]